MIAVVVFLLLLAAMLTSIAVNPGPPMSEEERERWASGYYDPWGR